MKQNSGFLGTYFERDSVLRLERWVRILAWGILAAYALEGGYNTFQNVSGALAGGYPVDWFSIFLSLSRILQGAALFAVLHVAVKVMLILLDIEDNTRRAARTNSRES